MKYIRHLLKKIYNAFAEKTALIMFFFKPATHAGSVHGARQLTQFK